MSEDFELPPERAIKEKIKELMQDGETEARSLQIAVLIHDDDEIDFSVSPKRVGMFLQNNRDLGFVTIEKRSPETGRTVWEFYSKE
jgi:hypothetical protein